MSEKESSKRNPVIIAEYERRAKKFRLGASGDLIKAIWNGFGDSLGRHIEYRWKTGDYLNAFHTSYRKLTGRPVNNCETIDDFFCSKFVTTFQKYFGKKEAVRIRKECELVMECPYSHNIYRPSYRSRRAAEYANVFFAAMVNSLDFICLDMTLEQAMTVEFEPTPFSYGSWEHMQYMMNQPTLDYRIAHELRNGNEIIFALIEEAILGDNNKIQISRSIISAIVKSGNAKALELLANCSSRQKSRKACDSLLWKLATVARLIVIFILYA